MDCRTDPNKPVWHQSLLKALCNETEFYFALESPCYSISCSNECVVYLYRTAQYRVWRYCPYARNTRVKYGLVSASHRDLLSLANETRFACHVSTKGVKRFLISNTWSYRMNILIALFMQQVCYEQQRVGNVAADMREIYLPYEPIQPNSNFFCNISYSWFGLTL